MRFLVTVQMLIEAADSDHPDREVRETENENDAFDFVDDLLVQATKQPAFIAGQIKDIKRTIRRQL